MSAESSTMVIPGATFLYGSDRNEGVNYEMPFVNAKIKELNEQFEVEKSVSMFGTSLAEQWKACDSDDRYSY